PQETPRPRHIVPDQSAKNLYSTWSDTLTRLVAPYLDYITSSTGNMPARLHALSAKCKDVVHCVKKASKILCLFQNYFEKLTVEWCTCEDLLQVLVKNGLFPTSPIQPRMAISIHLLDFYCALFEKSCNAVNAMASALNLFYARRGFVVLNKQYDFLLTDITKCMLFAMSAMHAYAHQWACQIIYNPQIRTGVGLTDGEGVECLWSRMHKLIAVSRSSGRSWRIYIINRHVGSIGQELRDDLGSWMRRRLSKRINVQEHKAHQWLTSSSIEKGVLRHDPRLTLSESTATPCLLRSLASLQNNQEQLKHDIEDLYASLSIQESFPELRGVDLEFIRILVIACDLKINVCKQAVGSFFEWERLDRASGGRDQSLANQQGHALHVNTSGWIACPTVMHLLQSNGFDCGVWVLANIAAVLVGFAVTGIMEQEIGLVHSSLLRYLAALPVHQS
ncbi:hypothetical protein J132_06976, partial [Termitomyces sp. J132]